MRIKTPSVPFFDDDTRVSRSIDTEEDVEELQKDLDKLYQWQEDNNMLFNGKKFEVLRYGPNSRSGKRGEHRVVVFPTQHLLATFG